MSGSPTKQVGFSIKLGSNTGLEKPLTHDIGDYTSTTYNTSATYIKRPVILCIKEKSRLVSLLVFPKYTLKLRQTHTHTHAHSAVQAICFVYLDCNGNT